MPDVNIDEVNDRVKKLEEKIEKIENGNISELRMREYIEYAQGLTKFYADEAKHYLQLNLLLISILIGVIAFLMNDFDLGLLFLAWMIPSLFWFLFVILYLILENPTQAKNYKSPWYFQGWVDDQKKIKHISFQCKINRILNNPEKRLIDDLRQLRILFIHQHHYRKIVNIARKIFFVGFFSIIPSLVIFVIINASLSANNIEIHFCNSLVSLICLGILSGVLLLCFIKDWPKKIIWRSIAIILMFLIPIMSLFFPNEGLRVLVVVSLLYGGLLLCFNTDWSKKKKTGGSIAIILIVIILIISLAFLNYPCIKSY